MAGYNNYSPYMYGYNGGPYGYNYQPIQGQNMQNMQNIQAMQNAQNMQNQQAQAQSQTTSSNLITVPNEQEARNYPVAPSHSVLMKDENSGYIYCKTMGYSQLDTPTFEKYRLVKEDTEPKSAEISPKGEKADDLSLYAKKDEYGALERSVKALEKEVNAIKKKLNRKDDEEDE